MPKRARKAARSRPFMTPSPLKSNGGPEKLAHPEHLAEGGQVQAVDCPVAAEVAEKSEQFVSRRISRIRAGRRDPGAGLGAPCLTPPRSHFERRLRRVTGNLLTGETNSQTRNPLNRNAEGTFPSSRPARCERLHCSRPRQPFHSIMGTVGCYRIPRRGRPHHHSRSGRRRRSRRAGCRGPGCR